MSGPGPERAGGRKHPGHRRSAHLHRRQPHPLLHPPGSHRAGQERLLRPIQPNPPHPHQLPHPPPRNHPPPIRLPPQTLTPQPAEMLLNAMLWLARSGAAWADIPARFGPHQTVYSRFCKWRDDGTLLRIFQELNADADYEDLCIDSTSIKAHPQSAGAKKGL